ncbi:hypothetical protein HDV05_003760 [Chytridiales sp. JEL 0842]|nr:hypothetical protein HDV05_003760 [Chytridiales sp. JEL 0842]
MSYTYVTEPPTKGKVVLKTTKGDLEIELWPKEAPKAVRNFVQLCMEGYYDDTIFHRVVKGFIVQGGDPTGTGEGGESIYNGPIVGDTIYNLLAMGEAEVDDDDRPLLPIKITGVDILWNPFEDIEPRTTREEKAQKAAMERARLEREAEKNKPKGKKNKSLLSFEDEEEGADLPIAKTKIKSSHDLLSDERLSKTVAVSKDEMKAVSNLPAPDAGAKSSKRPLKDDDSDDDYDSDLDRRKREEELKRRKVSAKKEAPKPTVQDEIQKVQQEIRQIETSRRALKEEQTSKKEAVSMVDSFRKQYLGKATMGKRAKSSEDDLLAQLNSFKSKLFKDPKPTKEDKPEWTCELHGMPGCKSCRSSLEDDLEDDVGWMAHELHFKKEAANVFEPTVDDYVLYDPREESKRKSGEKVNRDQGRLLPCFDKLLDLSFCKFNINDIVMEETIATASSPPSRTSFTQDTTEQAAEISPDSALSAREGSSDDVAAKEGLEGEGGEEGDVEPSEDGEEEYEEEEEDPAEETQPEYYGLDQHEIDFLEQREKRKKQLQQQLLDPTKVPASYHTLSKKESMVLDYVDNFNRQYVQIYPGRKELFLCPINEFDVKKFVCTTIRPTQLPFKELYDYRSCAKFVAEYLTYEPLDPPHELPTKLPSPTYTLKLQSGNCFDYSVLLVSLLRGFGYDAYVVSGYAIRDITILDETKTESDSIGIVSPTNLKDKKGSDAGESVKPTTAGGSGKYKVKPPRQLRSTFLMKQEDKKKALLLKEQEMKKLEADRARAVSFDSITDDAIKLTVEMQVLVEDDDELKGLRIHAWVLVLSGKREVAEPFFIEPSTGRVYSTDNENYLGVESVFSSANYWVNMQVCYDGLKGIQFDLGDNSKWEFVLLDNTQSIGTTPKTSDLQANDNPSDDEDDDDTNMEILDLPPSWVENLTLTKEQLESKCPSGSKSVIYKNAKIETFAEYHRADGMVNRMTFFADETKDFNGEIRESYANRRDKLTERIRTPDIGKVHEFFDPGRPHGLKEHVMIDGESTEIHFYPSARSDGLVKRVEKVNKIIEYFTEREDRLVYRSVTYEPPEHPDDERPRDQSAIIKMTEKFERNKNIPAHEDAAKKTYFVKDDKIKVIFHLEDGRIIPSYREFKKPNTDQKNSTLEAPISFEVNPYLKPPKKQHLYAQLCNLLKAEQNCIQAIKNSDREVKEILQARISEENDVNLVISVYDTIRNNTQKVTNEEEKEVHVKGEEEEAKVADLDYLSPFLVNYANPSQLTREEALAVRDACLKSLKERLIEKANIIQSRLEEVTTEYQRRQLAYSRNADTMSVEETDEYVRFCNDALFKIHILEKRLAKHKEAAPERYIELDTKLRKDPRIQLAF